MSSTPDPTITTALVTTTIDQSPQSHIERLHRAAIGPVGTDYYLPVLARLDTRDQAIPIWNWAACLCTLNWMVFRGLWTPALLYIGALLGAALAVLGLTQLATPVADSIEWSLWAGVVTLALLVPGFFGNAWLYAVYRKRLASALSGTASVQDACAMLDRQASSRPRLAWIAAANLVLAGLMLAIWLALPSPPRPAPVDGDRVVPAAQPASGAATGPDAAGNATAQAPSGPVGVATPVSAAEPTPAPAAVASAPSAPEIALAAGETASASQSVPASASAGTVAAQALPDKAPPAPELRRSTRFGAAPRTPVAGPMIATSDAAPGPAAALAAQSAQTGQFQVNVGLFAQDDNARRVHARLRDAGLPVHLQSLQRPGRILTRVRVGPFATRAQAQAAAQKIRALQLDAVVARQ